ncbi:unnamed protein product [Pieris brassicae]|uniref:Uncharacterized protein n=1 Tax=Pieris brassicae TaxID=7116 RepID=A0A9P0XHC0_PIEBR|nr:unnamed protein product [Pieris brassicae]
MSVNPKPQNSTPQMPMGTRNFLQKLIQKETASVDMTRHGFIRESHPIRLFLKPLRTQIQKIHGKAETVERNKFTKDKTTTDTSTADKSTPIICKFIEEKKLVDKKKKRKLKCSTKL